MILNKLRIITIFLICLLSASTSVMLGADLTLDSNIFNVSLGIASKGQFYSPSTSKSSTLYIIRNAESVNVQIGGSIYFEKIELREIEGLDVIGDKIITSHTKSTASYDPIDFQIPALSYDGIYAILTYYKGKVNGVCYIARNPKSVNGFAYTYNTSTSNTASLIENVSVLPSEVSIPANVTISNGGETESFKVTYLWDECLSGCSKIEKLTIPNTVGSIGFSAFKGCKGLKNLVIEDGTNALDIDKYALNSSTYITPFYDCPLESVYIGRKGGGASDQNSSWFTGQKKLASVSFGASITEIGGYMFYGCTQLDDIILPDGIKNINQYAFAGCTSLRKINLPNGLIKIEWYAFNNCKELIGVILPESITQFGLRNYVGPEVCQPASVFSGCTSLSDVICLYPASVGNPQIPSTAKLFVPNSLSYSWGEDIASLADERYTYTSSPISPEIIGNYSNEFAELYGIKISYILNENIVDAGTYSLNGKVRIVAAGMNYEYDKPLSFSIEKAPITISVGAYEREYGDNNPIFNYDVKGWLGNDTETTFVQAPVVSTSATISSNVGEYPITISGANLKNYTPNYTFGSLTVTRAPLLVTCPDYTRLYGDSNPQVQLIYTGFKNNETESILEAQPKITIDASISSPVGDYSIMCGEAASTNYNISYASGTLSVTPAPLTIVCPDYTRHYKEENPNVILEYIGLKASDNKTIFSVEPIIAIDATQDSPVGEYTISCSGAKADNYEIIEYRNGLLTIIRADQSIIWNQDFDNIIVGKNYQLTATSTSGTSVKYLISEGVNVVTWFDDSSRTYFFRAETDDEFTITAYVDESRNYNAVAATPIIVSPKYPPLQSITVGFMDTYYLNMVGIPLVKTDKEPLYYFYTNQGTIMQVFSYREPTLDIKYLPSVFPLEDFEIVLSDNSIVELNKGFEDPGYIQKKISPLKEGITHLTISCKSDPSITAEFAIQVYDNSASVTDIVADDNVKLTVSGNTLSVTGLNDTVDICIFSTDGRSVYHGKDRNITLVGGFYIVRIGSLTYKIKM